ncbi:MAG: hypothetical protein VZS44_04140 [Bacilli bacterium]|nr:hypothetical protein [Bacilli bacterium]
MKIDIKKLSEQDILASIRDLTIAIQIMNGNILKPYSFDDFIYLDKDKINGMLNRFNIPNAEDKMDIINEYKEGLDFIFGDFFVKTQENLRKRIELIVEEINSKIESNNKEIVLRKEEKQREINFLNDLWHYLYDLDSLSEKEIPKLEEFIMSSELDDDDKVLFSEYVASLIVRRNKYKDEKELRDFDDSLLKIDSVIENKNVSDNEKEVKDHDELYIKISKLDINSDRRELLYNLLKKYEDVFRDYAPENFEKLDFFEWIDENKYDSIKTIIDKSVIAEDEFYQVLETVAKDLIDNSNEEEVNKCKELVTKIMSDFNISNKDYDEKINEISKRIKNLIDKIQSSDFCDELEEYNKRLNELSKEVSIDSVYSDSGFTKIEDELDLIEGIVDNYGNDLEELEFDIDEYTDEEIINLINKSGEPKKVIFASTMREAYAFKDIKKIDREFYKTIFQKLLLIENGVKEVNKTKEGIFNSNNKKLGKLSYKKGGKVRIYYKALPDNCVYIVFVNIIKDTNSKKKVTSVVNRVKNVSDEYDSLKKLFKSTNEKDNKKKNKIILENLVIRDQIYEYLGQEPPAKINVGEGHGRK